MIVEKSELLKERLSREAKMAAEATIATTETDDTIQSGYTYKRPAPDSYEQPKKREMEYRHHIVDAISRVDHIDKISGVGIVQKTEMVAE